jgi:hypothetical protein
MSQTDRIITDQWAHALIQQGVLPENICVWKETDPCMPTLFSQFGGVPLDVPDALIDKERVMCGTGVEALTSRATKEIAAWAQDSRASGLVVILAVHGMTSLTGPWLEVGDEKFTPENLLKMLAPMRHKPILVILECCFAAQFADAVIKAAQPGPGNLWLLASGNDFEVTTAYVLGAHQSIPNFGDCQFAIYGTGFHRSIFATIFYSRYDDSLANLPAHLNSLAGDRRGFDARLIGTNPPPMLRHFFGLPVSPDQLVIRKGRPSVKFGQILPPPPPGGSRDDIGYFQHPDQRHFLRAKEVEKGRIHLELLYDRYIEYTWDGAQWKVEFGRLNGIHHRAILCYVVVRKCITCPGEYVPVGQMVDRVLHRKSDLLARADPGGGYIKELREIANDVRQKNGLNPGDEAALVKLRLLLGNSTVDTCCDLLEDARDDILAERHPEENP